MSTHSYTLTAGLDNRLVILSDADLTNASNLLVRIYRTDEYNIDDSPGSYTVDSNTAHSLIVTLPAAAIAGLGGAFYRVEGANGFHSTFGKLLPPDRVTTYARQADVDILAEQIATLTTGNVDPGDGVTRAHLWDVPALPGLPDDVKTPGMYYDSSNNMAGVGNSILEVFTLPGVILQRVTGIDSGKIATRRNYANTWSSWVIETPGGGGSVDVNSIVSDPAMESAYAARKDYYTGPAFMALQTTTPDEMDTANQNYMTHALVQAVWDQLQQDAAGEVDATSVNNLIAQAKAAGLKVCLEVALQYPPANVASQLTKFKDQDGNEWAGAQGSGDQVYDWIWSGTGRNLVGNFLHRLFDQINWADVDRVRLGGLQKGELQFPGLGQTAQWWAFSDPAQTGNDLAPGMASAPLANHIPSTGTTWNDDDANFYAWYRQSMVNWLSWLVKRHRKYFDGPIWVMHPGAGLRPVSQTPTSSDQGANWRINASKGLDWDSQIASYPDANVWPYSTWADSEHFWAPAWADDVHDGNAAPWYHLLRTAKKYGRAGRIWGENTGGQTDTDMDRVFTQGAVAYGYEGFAWMSAGSLSDGNGGDTYNHLAFYANRNLL